MVLKCLVLASTACRGLVGSKPKLDKEEEMSLMGVISRPIVSRLVSGVHGFLSLMNHLEGRKLASGVVSSVPSVTRGKIQNFLIWYRLCPRHKREVVRILDR